MSPALTRLSPGHALPDGFPLFASSLFNSAGFSRFSLKPDFLI
jgi:hypothetical protein